MKAFHITVAMWLLTGSQYASAVPTTELLDVLQSNGLENVNAKDLSSILQSLASGSPISGAAQQKAATGNGQAADGDDSAASEGSQSNGDSDAGRGDQAAQGGQAAPGGDAAQGGEAAQGGQAAEGVEGEEGKENEINITGAFDTPVAVQGGDVKQDIQFTKSTVGSFEYEFKGTAADTVTVSENKSPAPPPAGFEALEKSSYKVALATSKGAGLSLSKIDFIFDPTSAGLQGKDITKAQVGKLCVDTGAFTISETLGELEFEAEENEVTLNLNKQVTAEGEWGIFLPLATAGAATGNGTEQAAAGAGAAKGEAGTGEKKQKQKAASVAAAFHA